MRMRLTWTLTGALACRLLLSGFSIYDSPTVVWAWVPHHVVVVARRISPGPGGPKMTADRSTTTSRRRPPRRDPAPLYLSNFYPGAGSWDNDNFLDSLSRGSDAQNQANQDYYAQSRFRPPAEGGDEEDQEEKSPIPRNEIDNNNNNSNDSEALEVKDAVLTAEMKARVKAARAAPEEEASQGGRMFRELLARAQQQSSSLGLPTGRAAPPPPSLALGGGNDLNQLSVEEQAQLFRQMMMSSSSSQPTPDPPLVRPTPPLSRLQEASRRVGRNRDADAIVNTSDVYFAQLKLDSSLRNLARFSGEEDKANQVFADPAIQDIKLHVNPYLQEAKRQEQALLETIPEEALLDPTALASSSNQVDRSYTGVSYKDKLQQRRKQAATPQRQEQPPPPPPQQQPAQQQLPPPQQQRVPNIDNNSISQSTATTSIPATSAPWAPKEPESNPITRSAVAAEVKTESRSSRPPTATTAVPPPMQRDMAASSLSTPPLSETRSYSTSSTSVPNRAAVAPPVTTAAPSSTTMETGEIRTLMGLLLKHRGGPGFGAGRLQGAEIDRFAQLTGRLTTALRQEASQFVSTPKAPAPVVTAPPPVAAAPSPMGNRPLGNTVAATAANTFNPSLGGGAMAPIPKVPIGERLNSMLACIDGATQMYRNSPPELQEGVLVTLRAALLSAVNTCNEIIAYNEMQNYEAYRTAISDPRTRRAEEARPPSPRQFYDVVPQNDVQVREPAVPRSEPIWMDEQGGGVPSSPPTTDLNENDPFYRMVYDKLQNASGEGMMGLRQDMTPEEASNLADDLAKMRSLLVQELDV